MDGIKWLMTFLQAHWLDVTVVIGFIAIMVGLWVKGYKKQVKKIVLSLVVKAEQELGSGSGPIKYGSVTRWIYERMPWVIKIFISDDELDDMIEDAVMQLKHYLKEDDKLLLSYNEEKLIK